MSDFATVNYQDEIRMRMAHYFEQPDVMTLFVNALNFYDQVFFDAARQIIPHMLSERGEFVQVRSLALDQIEDVCRVIGICGYQFLETGYPGKKHSFYKYMSLRHQPYLDELFAIAFHRELNTLQYHIQEFLENADLGFSDLTSIDVGEKPVTLLMAEKISQGLFIPAFDLIRREYIYYTVSKIKEYNPHRAFHRLNELQEKDKHTLLQYIRYIIQGDQLISEGELNFVDNVVEKLNLKDFDPERYVNSLQDEIQLSDLGMLSESLIEHLRRQVLGLVIDCAFADKVLAATEQLRILEIAELVLTKPYPKP